MTDQSALAASLLRGVAKAATENGAQNTMNPKDANALTYPVRDGWLDNWLLAGPQTIVLPTKNYRFDAPARAAVLDQYRADAMPGAPFVEGAEFSLGDDKLAWNATRCQDDHLVDMSAWFTLSSFVRYWAFVELDVPDAREVAFKIWSNGPVAVWNNGQPIYQARNFHYNDFGEDGFKTNLSAGKNALLARFEHIGVLNTPLSLALRGDDLDGVTARVPVPTPDPARRQALEDAFARVAASRDTYAPTQKIQLLVPRLSRDCGAIPVEVRRGKTLVKIVSWNTGVQSARLDLGTASEFKEGGYQIALADGQNRREVRVRVETPRHHSTSQAGTTWEKRRLKSLEAATQRAGAPLDPNSNALVNMWNSAALRSEIAKMALGRWDEVQISTLLAYIKGVALVQDGCEFRLIDLMGMQLRFGNEARYPAIVTSALEGCILGFRYWNDEPGRTTANYHTENHSLGFHAVEILAGQMFPDATFANNGQSGVWHRQHGEALALGWLDERGHMGFQEWDSNHYFSFNANVLSHLADFAATPQVQAHSTRVLDKVYLEFALNSFEGVFGSTHGRTAVEYVKDGRDETVANLAYLAWGTGGINDRVDEAVALACADYRVPRIIQDIALDEPEALWNRERSGFKEGRDVPVDKVTYKTPDWMLCSAQSWKPGQNGYQQHIWQATLSPEAPVFVTHPACISQSGNRRPNFWVGNQTLPHVAQWHDCLVAVHQLRAEDWLDFTHAYFPTFAFDEWKLSGDWAFARVGDGYLALRARNGLKLIDYGDSAWRELRSAGRENIWLCQMGRRAQDDDFAAFMARVAALPITFDGLSVEAQTLRGDTLQFGWDGPLLLNGQEQPISDFPHFDSPFAHAPWPASQLEIWHGDQKLSLDYTQNA